MILVLDISVAYIAFLLLFLKLPSKLYIKCFILQIKFPHHDMRFVLLMIPILFMLCYLWSR